MGPLVGVEIVEFAGLGPGPMAAMLLADLGASIVRIERREAGATNGYADPVLRSREAVGLDLKDPDDLAQALKLVGQADAVIEGFRPGVMEGLGLGPDTCLALNPALIYARMTGWGQSGPLARRAGHDINYIALSGALHRIGHAGLPPAVPLNLIGDYGGGALYLAFGLVSALLHARATGVGQVLDVAMIDGTASLMARHYGQLAAGQVWPGQEQNVLDGGAPFYNTYTCADGGFIAVGAIEAKFFAELLRGLGIAAAEIAPQHDRAGWPQTRALFAARFASQKRDHWAALFADTDACVTPVLSMHEALEHPHIRARATFLDLGGVAQPAPAPRFSVTQAPPPSPALRSTVDAVLRGRSSRPRRAGAKPE